MAGCKICGEDFGDFAFECAYCGDHHCATHRLPERHDCPAIGEAIVPGRGGGGGDGAADDLEEPADRAEREEWWREERDATPYRRVEPQTMGTAPEDFGDPSPDVAIDGSIKRERGSAPVEDEDPGREWGWLREVGFWIVILGGVAVLLAVILAVSGLVPVPG